MKRKLFTLLCSVLLASNADAFTNLGNGQYRTDGSKDDVSAAAKAAPPGSTILLPRGTFTWTGTCFIDKSVNIFGDGTTILNNHTPNNPFEEKGVFKINSTGGYNVEIKGIAFRIASSNTGSYTGMCQLWFYSTGGSVLLLHDCSIDTSPTVAKGLRLYPNRAVIWNCTFNGSHNGYEDGIAIQDGNDTYPKASTMGQSDESGTSNIYVEDTKFNNISPGYALDISDGGRVVVRYCTFTNSYIGSHGQESSPYGMRHAEVYNCTFTVDQNESQTQAALWIRGGTWAIHHNTFATLAGKSTIMMQVLALTGGIGYHGTHICPTQYPIPRQIGQGWIGQGGYSYSEMPQNGDGYTTEPVYIWSNNQSSPSIGYGDKDDSCGNNLKSANFVKSGRDYIIGTAKPNYTAFTYPHPLRSGGPTPTPSPTPSPSPTPTPAPSPTPTPTPTPAPTYERWMSEQNDWIRSHPPTPD